jgi:SpoVK/Ycf46/Vps4 family AAA+-type ATPase
LKGKEWVYARKRKGLKNVNERFKKQLKIFMTGLNNNMGSPIKTFPVPLHSLFKPTPGPNPSPLYPLGIGVKRVGIFNPTTMEFGSRGEGNGPCRSHLGNKGDLYKNASFYHYLLYRKKNEKKGNFNQLNQPGYNNPLNRVVGETGSSLFLSGGLHPSQPCSVTAQKNSLLVEKGNAGIFYGVMDTFLSPYSHSLFQKSLQKSFFPYRKSFWCYWLLPFVGFIYGVNNTGVFSSLTLPTTVQSVKPVSFEQMKEKKANSLIPNPVPTSGWKVGGLKSGDRDRFNYDWTKEGLEGEKEKNKVNNFRIENLPIFSISNKSVKESSSNMTSENVPKLGYNTDPKNLSFYKSGYKVEKTEPRLQSSIGVSLLIKKSCTLYLHSLEEYLKNPTLSTLYQGTEGSQPRLPRPQLNQTLKRLEPGFWYDLAIPNLDNGDYKWNLGTIKNPVSNLDKSRVKYGLPVPNLLTRFGKGQANFEKFGLKMGLFLNEIPFQPNPSLTLQGRVKKFKVGTEFASDFVLTRFSKQYGVKEKSDRENSMNNPVLSYKRAALLLDNYYKKELLKTNPTLSVGNLQGGFVNDIDLQDSGKVSSELSVPKEGQIYTKLTKKELYKLIFHKLNDSLDKMVLSLTRNATSFKSSENMTLPTQTPTLNGLDFEPFLNKTEEGEKQREGVGAGGSSTPQKGDVSSMITGKGNNVSMEKTGALEHSIAGSLFPNPPYGGVKGGKENFNLEKNILASKAWLEKENRGLGEMVLNQNISYNMNRISVTITHQFLSKFQNLHNKPFRFGAWVGDQKLLVTPPTFQPEVGTGLGNWGAISFPYNPYNFSKENENGSIRTIKKRKGVLKYVHPLLISPFTPPVGGVKGRVRDEFPLSILSKKTEENGAQIPLKIQSLDSSFKYKKEHFLKNRVSISNMESEMSFSNMSLKEKGSCSVYPKIEDFRIAAVDKSKILGKADANDFLYYSKFLNNYTSKFKKWILLKGEPNSEAVPPSLLFTHPSFQPEVGTGLGQGGLKSMVEEHTGHFSSLTPKPSYSNSNNSKNSNNFKKKTRISASFLRKEGRIEKTLRSFLSIKTSKISKKPNIPSLHERREKQPPIVHVKESNKLHYRNTNRSLWQSFNASLHNKKSFLKIKRELFKFNIHKKLLTPLKTYNPFILSALADGRKLILDKPGLQPQNQQRSWIGVKDINQNKTRNKKSSFLERQNSIFKLSPRLLVKNRMFIKDPISLKQIQNLLLTDTQTQALFNPTLFNPTLTGFGSGSKGEGLGIPSLSENLGPSPKMETKKNLQKKRRKKKMKKETRRRKKRKRFYPRPLWIRYRLFNSLAKKRYYAFLALLKTLKLENMSSNSFNTLSNNSFASSTFPNPSLTPFQPPVGKGWGSSGRTAAQADARRNSILSLNENQNFYKVSRNVLGDLNRLLWKSYWLSSNLNPYLKTVRSSLNQMKKSAQIWDFYKTLKSLLSYLGGFESLIPNQKINYRKDTNSLNNWKTALYLAEYNRISYQRIQKYISQIRENLTPSGEIKVRSPHLGHLSTARLARKREADLQKSADFWIKFGKTIISYTEGSYEKSFFNKNGHFLEGKGAGQFFTNFKSPNLRTYWAFSKTNLASFKDKDLNKRNQTWAIEKKREQTKHNKTKKMYKTISEKLQDLLRNEEGSLYDKFVKKGLTDRFLDITVADVNSRVVLSFNTLNKNQVPNSEAVGNVSLRSASRASEEMVNSPMGSEKEKTDKIWPSLVKKSLKKIRVQELKVQFYGFKPSLLYPPRFAALSKSKMLRRNWAGVRIEGERRMNDTWSSQLTNKSAYWWDMKKISGSFLTSFDFSPGFSWERGQSLYLNRIEPSQTQNFNNQILWISTLLFHFCAILSLLSISQIRGVLKFAFLGFSKIYKSSNKILSFISDSMLRLKSLLISYNLSVIQSPYGGLNGAGGPTAAQELESLIVQRKMLEDNSKTSVKTMQSNRKNTSYYRQSLFKPRIYLPTFNLFINNPSPLSPYKPKNQKHHKNLSTSLLFKTGYSPTIPFKGSLEPGLVEGAGRDIPKLLYPFNPPTSFPKKKEGGLKQDRKGVEGLNLNRPFIFSKSKKDKKSFYLVQKRSFWLNADFYSHHYKLLKISSFPKNDGFRTASKIENLNPDIKKKSGTFYSSVFTNTISLLIKSKLFSLYSGTFSLFKQVLETFARLEGSSLTAKQKQILTPAIGSSGTINKTDQAERGQKKSSIFSGSNFIFQFFEKPGELIIDWIAYMFLVEWASDMPNIIPENFDMYLANSSFKVLRTVHNMNLWTLTELMNYSLVFTTKSLLTQASTPPTGSNSLERNLAFSFFYPSSNFKYGTLTSMFRNDVREITGYNIEASQKIETSLLNMNKEISLLSLGSTFIQRRLYYLYEILLFQMYQPDTDLNVRQKRGILFWDIWGDFLTQTAEDSNINISELTSLKEEQFKLLEKCAEISESKHALLAQAPFKKLATQPISNTGSPSLREGLAKPFEGLPQIGAWAGGSPTHLKKAQSRIVFPSLKPKNLKSFEGNSKNNPYDFLDKNKEKEKNKKNFAAQQFLSYQGKDTELFIELHPPKSFNMIRLIHQNEAVQQPIGSLVCQIFSGLLSKQISKNILVVGGSNQSVGGRGLTGQGIEKTLLVQAIAGETELKIITDNAYRYAMVYRGVAVGIKLLRDVFDSLALHTPCLFLIEDIHAIGERRPLLISDEDSGKGSNSSVFGSQREEIHEKNQVLYQLSKHQITNYRKPYKGDFSLSIPTNHFCFSLFFTNPNSTSTSNGGFEDVSNSSGNFGKIVGTVSNSKRLLSPKINVSTSDGGSENQKDGKTNPETGGSGASQASENQQKKSLSSRLLLKKSELLAPPATSPFSVLTLKEEKKFKPYKVVSEIPWAGLPSEQLAQISKASYSIRVKVALLAEMAISSLTVKLDMITDLLVIMDSVKGNRGFVVFATTHVPYILDPALRRPGRLDETITLGSFPTLLCRWEILKSSFGLFNHYNTKGRQSFIAQQLGYSKGISLDLTLSPLAFGTASNIFNFGKLNSNVNVIHRDLKKWISNHYQNPKNSYNYQSRPLSSFQPSVETRGKEDSNFKESLFLNKEKQLSNIYSTNPNLVSTMTAIVHSKTTTHLLTIKGKNTKESLSTNATQDPTLLSFAFEKKESHTRPALREGSEARGWGRPRFAKGGLERKILSKTYFMASVSLRSASANLNFASKPVQDRDANRLTKETKHKLNGLKKIEGFFEGVKGNSQIAHLQHKYHLKKQKTPFLSYPFIDNPFPLNVNVYGNVNGLYSFSSNYLSFFASPYQLKNQVILLISGKIGEILYFSKNSSQTGAFTKEHPGSVKGFLSKHGGWDGFRGPEAPSAIYTTYGLSKTWQVLSSLIVSFIQKRFIYHQNLIVPKLFDISNYNSIHEPPSPPSSNILLPARRYENYKRSFSFYSGIQNASPQSTSILDKLQLHQQQRLIKKLYRFPVQESYRSEIIANRMTGFSNASLMIGSLTRDVLQKPSRSNWFIKNNILKRHRNYLTNQWWNGQLPEHNTETTFLSDIDWRYTFVDSVGDLLLDFPDADSHYNPRNRRWFLTKGLTHNWFNFEKNIYSEIYSHLIFDAFVKAFHLYEKNREVLDYYAFHSLKNGLYNSLHEFNMLKLYQRFVPFALRTQEKK